MRIFRIVVFISVSFLLINNSCFPQFKYLFTDDRWIANTYAVSRELHQPEKISNNPLMIADKEWEQGINCFGTVLFDEGKYRMWYQVYNLKEKADKRYATMVGYAESKDGLNWLKPELGLFEYKGSNKNNIVLPSWGSSDLYSPAVIKDIKDKDPQRRYKMLYWDAMSKENYDKSGCKYSSGKTVPGWTALPGEGFFVAFSADGIHWNKYGTQPVFSCACDASSVMQNEDGSFSAYFKMSIREERHFRELGIATSKNFTDWTEPEIILQPDWNDANGTEFYGMSVTPYFGNYLGLIWMYYNSPDNKLMDIQLAQSDNSKEWHRAANRKVFMPVGSEGEWDAGGVVVASQMLISTPAFPEELLIYYGGVTTRHDDSRALHRENSIGLAKLRIDGFASLDAKLFPGFVETKAIKFSKNQMYINAALNHGYLYVELINPITNKVIARSKTYNNINSTKIKVEWLSQPAGGYDNELIYKFYMKKASLYSFWFE